MITIGLIGIEPHVLLDSYVILKLYVCSDMGHFVGNDMDHFGTNEKDYLPEQPRARFDKLACEMEIAGGRSQSVERELFERSGRLRG